MTNTIDLFSNQYFISFMIKLYYIHYMYIYIYIYIYIYTTKCRHVSCMNIYGFGLRETFIPS